jgi:hypothetical protein
MESRFSQKPGFAAKVKLRHASLFCLNQLLVLFQSPSGNTYRIIELLRIVKGIFDGDESTRYRSGATPSLAAR